HVYRDVGKQRRLVVVGGLHVPPGSRRRLADLDVLGGRVVHHVYLEVLGDGGTDRGGIVAADGVALHQVERPHHLHVVEVDRGQADTGVTEHHPRYQEDDPAEERDTPLSKTHRSNSPQWIAMPMRPQIGPPARCGSQLNQIRVALPTRFSSGTKPQERPSSLLSRLSPIIRYCPGGTSPDHAAVRRNPGAPRRPTPGTPVPPGHPRRRGRTRASRCGCTRAAPARGRWPPGRISPGAHARQAAPWLRTYSRSSRRCTCRRG